MVNYLGAPVPVPPQSKGALPPGGSPNNPGLPKQMSPFPSVPPGGTSQFPTGGGPGDPDSPTGAGRGAPTFDPYNNIANQFQAMHNPYGRPNRGYGNYATGGGAGYSPNYQMARWFGWGGGMS